MTAPRDSRRHIATVVVGLLGLCNVASATPATLPADAATAARFAVGAGVSWPSFGETPAIAATSTSLGGQSGLGLLGSALPSAVVSAEIRLASSEWLMTALSLGYSSGESGTPADTTAETPTAPLVKASSTQLAVGLGWRHVHNPGALVEVSGYAMLSIRRGASTTESTSQPNGAAASTATETVRTALEVGGALGVTIDARLTEALRLRLASPLLYGGQTRSELRRTGTATANAGDSNSRDTGVGLRFAPTLTMRFLF